MHLKTVAMYLSQSWNISPGNGSAFIGRDHGTGLSTEEDRREYDGPR